MKLGSKQARIVATCGTLVFWIVAAKLSLFDVNTAKATEVVGVVFNQKAARLSRVEVRILDRRSKEICGIAESKNGAYRVPLSADCRYVKIEFEKSRKCHLYSKQDVIDLDQPIHDLGMVTLQCPERNPATTIVKKIGGTTKNTVRTAGNVVGRWPRVVARILRWF